MKKTFIDLSNFKRISLKDLDVTLQKIIALAKHALGGLFARKPTAIQVKVSNELRRAPVTSLRDVDRIPLWEVQKPQDRYGDPSA